MAVKSVIDIEVNDEAFERFAAIYAQYEEKLKNMPEAWKNIDSAMSKASTDFNSASTETQAIMLACAASAGMISDEILRASKHQKHFQEETKKSDKSLHTMAETAKKVSSTLLGVGKTMVKFGFLGSGLAALGGIGSGFGLGELANSAMYRQRGALGLGMTPGQEAAFATYFNQFGDAGSVSQNVASARNDVTKRWVFSAMGIGDKALAHDSNFQLSGLAEERAQAMVKAMPKGEWLNMAKALGLTQIFSEDNLRVLRHSSTASVQAAYNGATRNQSVLGFSGSVADEWTALSIALHKAGIEIESSLITGLSKLAPELTKVSREVSDWIAAFLKGPDIGKWTAMATTGLEEFSYFIGSRKFQNDMQEFADGVGAMASETVNALRYFGLIPTAAPTVMAIASAQSRPAGAGGNIVTRGMALAIHQHQLAGDYSPAHIAALSAAADKKYHLPAGTMERLAMVESSFGANDIGPRTKYGRAYGPWQMLPSVAKLFGVTNQASATQDVDASAHYIALESAYYKSYQKGIGAYNWGPGNLSNDIAKHGKEWLKYAPGQTQGEVSAVVGKNAAATDASIRALTRAVNRNTTRPGSKVTVSNSSSSRIAIQGAGAHL